MFYYHFWPSLSISLQFGEIQGAQIIHTLAVPYENFSTGCCSSNSNLLSWFSSKPNNLSRLSCIQKQQVVVTIKPGLVLCVLRIFYQAPKEGIGDDWQKAPVRSSWLLEVSPIKTIPYFIGESQHLIAFLRLHFQSRKGDIKIPCSF